VQLRFAPGEKVVNGLYSRRKRIRLFREDDFSIIRYGRSPGSGLSFTAAFPMQAASVALFRSKAGYIPIPSQLRVSTGFKPDFPILSAFMRNTVTIA
jgi:hypothetical protein